MKKVIVGILTLVMVLSAMLSLAGCQDKKTDVQNDTPVSATEESQTAGEKETETMINSNLNPDEITQSEQESIDLLASDMTVVTDENFGEIVNEAIYHTSEFSGKVYQLEGVYTTNTEGGVPYLYRFLVNGEEETFCGLPLVYLNKQFNDGDWIKVTGIFNAHEINGASITALEIVAAQRLPQAGQEKIPWSGAAHDH